MNNLPTNPNTDAYTPMVGPRRPAKVLSNKVGQKKDKLRVGGTASKTGAASDDIKTSKKSNVAAPADIDLNPKIKESTDVNESVSRPAVVYFGRMNPPTHGHSKLINKVHEVAAKTNGRPMVFLSRSHDKKNPLQYSDKLKYAKKAFGSVIKHHDNANTFFGAVKHAASLGHKEIHVVVGGDRHEEISNLLHKYNGPGKEYSVKLHVHSAGDRDETAAGSAGMSASKARAHAAAGNVTKFGQCLPKALHSDSGDIMRKVRNGMNILHEGHTAAQLKTAVDNHQDGWLVSMNKSARLNGTLRDIVGRGRSTSADSELFNKISSLKQKSDRRAKLHIRASDAAKRELMKKAAIYKESIDTLLEVYDRGANKWSPETSKLTQEQYAYGRVNSYLARGLAYRLDSDLHESVETPDEVPLPAGHTRFWHGTSSPEAAESIGKEGINRFDKDTGRISITKHKGTAFGYAAMQGGQASTLANGVKAKTAPMEHRRAIELHIPNDWLHNHRDHEYDKHWGNGISAKAVKEYKLHPDALSEIRVKKAIPKEFIAKIHKKEPKQITPAAKDSKHKALAAKFMQKFGKKNV